MLTASTNIELSSPNTEPFKSKTGSTEKVIVSVELSLVNVNPSPDEIYNTSLTASANNLSPLSPFTSICVNAFCAGLGLVIVTIPVAASLETVRAAEPACMSSTPVLVILIPDPFTALTIIPAPADLPVAAAGSVVELPKLITPSLVTVAVPDTVELRIPAPAATVKIPVLSISIESTLS